MRLKCFIYLRILIWFYSLGARMPACHAGDTGSIPVRAANLPHTPLCRMTNAD